MLGGFSSRIPYSSEIIFHAIGIEFQQRYATMVLELEQLNKDLNKVLHKVQQYCYELAPDQGLQPADQLMDTRRRCEEESQKMVLHADSSALGSGLRTECVRADCLQCPLWLRRHLQHLSDYSSVPWGQGHQARLDSEGTGAREGRLRFTFLPSKQHLLLLLQTQASKPHPFFL